MRRRHNSTMTFRAGQLGFTMIDVVLAIIIVGILLTVAMRGGRRITATARMEETRREMDALARASVGNPELSNHGVRFDFGYVGDVGALPPNLQALLGNPGGYTTWKGPYIETRFTQAADDYLKDAWGVPYQYSGDVTITSAGSGSSLVRHLAVSTDDLLRNCISGAVTDLDGTPPGQTYRDSVTVRITLPDGSGGTVTRSQTTDAGGYFSFDSVPIGNHEVRIIWVPGDDTLRRFVSVPPGASPTAEFRLAADLWSAGAGILLVPGSDTLSPPGCSRLRFWVTNTSTTDIAVGYLRVTWTTQTAYYRNVIWNTQTVRSGPPALGSGDTASFTGAQVLQPGDSIPIRIETFQSLPGGGPRVDMNGEQFTVEFSNGSIITFTADYCQ